MGSAIYNSAIPKMKPANRAPVPAARSNLLLATLLLLFSAAAFGLPSTNWSGFENQLAQKIVTLTGPGAIALTIENRSPLNKRESEIISNGLRTALESMGVRIVPAEQSAATISITLSENQTSYVWVAQVRQGKNDPAIVMVSMERPEGFTTSHDSVPLTLRLTSLWKQRERILDVAVLEENTVPVHMAVLDGQAVTLYRWQGQKWIQEQSLPIAHARPWPRDLRGRLIPAKDHLLDVYLPGVMCRTSGAPLELMCRESDDPWPLTPAPLNAFFAPTRNFFTGVISPRIGKFSNVPKFYSAAYVPREKYVLWLFSGADGAVHMIDGVSDSIMLAGASNARGSDIASVRTTCGAGWQVLATNSMSPEHGNESIQAYEFPDRDPVAVSAPTELEGSVTGLWVEAKGDTALVIVNHPETEEYEAFRVALACGS